MQEFAPHLEILPAAQRRLWEELRVIPLEFVLYGETAIALHLGHRNSVDFDFFGNLPLDPQTLEGAVPFLTGAKITQRDKNTLSATVDRDGPVKVSFFGVPKLARLRPPHKARGNGIKIASLLDLAGTKASVVQVRAESKDYLDLDALMRLASIGLPVALAAAQMIYGSSFNPQITLKALSYFDDGNLRDLPDEVRNRLVDAAREVDLDRLPVVGDLT